MLLEHHFAIPLRWRPQRFRCDLTSRAEDFAGVGLIDAILSQNLHKGRLAGRRSPPMSPTTRSA